MDIASLFGARVRSLRKKRGLTQQELGEASGVNYKYVGAVERGDQNPTLSVIAKLSAGLGVSPSDLLDFDHEADEPALLRQKLESELADANTDELRVALRMVRALRR